MYEYKVVPVNRSLQITEDLINKLSLEGWRLVGGDIHILYFEKKKSSDTQYLTENSQ